MTKYPAGGEREPVYKLLEKLGFNMSTCSDKQWTRPGCTLIVFGAGSMAQIRTDDDMPAIECSLDRLEATIGY